MTKRRFEPLEEPVLEPMVMTVLEARVAPGRGAALRAGFDRAAQSLPPQMLQSLLLRRADDGTLWQIVSLWRSRGALEQYRASVDAPKGVLLFRGVDAEPSLTVFEVALHAAPAAAGRALEGA